MTDPMCNNCTWANALGLCINALVLSVTTHIDSLEQQAHRQAISRRKASFWLEKANNIYF